MPSSIAPAPPSRTLPKVTCEYCGSTWFRRAPVEQYQDTIWEEEAVSQVHLALYICLCGMPRTPQLGGVHAGTAALEIDEFMENFQAVQNTEGVLMTKAAAERLLVDIQSALISKKTMREVLAEAAAAQRKLGRWLRIEAGQGSKPGRPWSMPERKPATRGRDQMVVALQERGYTLRESRRLVRKFWGLMAELIRCGEVVDTPIGQFKAVTAPEPQVRRRFGKRQILFARRRRIKFRPYEI